MNTTIDVTIDAGAAHTLQSPARYEAAGRYPSNSNLLKDGGVRELLADAKREARADALTNAELEAWRSERNA